MKPWERNYEVEAAKPWERGFVAEDDGSPLDGAMETVKNLGRVYPVAETAANLATQAVAIPVSGIAGLGALAAGKLGLTDADPTQVIHDTASALTYDPQTEGGRQLTNAATYPFQKLAEGGRAAGDATLDATGSPALATAVDTAINAAPMALGVKAKPKGPLEAAADVHKSNLPENPVTPEIPPVEPDIPFRVSPETTPDALESVAADATKQTPEGVGINPLEKTAQNPEIASGDLPRQGEIAPIPTIEDGMPVADQLAQTAEIARPAEAVNTNENHYPLGAAEAVKPWERDFIVEDHPAIETPDIVPEAMKAEAAMPEPEALKPVDESAAIAGQPVAEAMPDAVQPDTIAPLSERYARASEAEPSNMTMPETPVDSFSPGAAYVGNVDNIQTAGKLTDKPIRREDVLIPFMKDLGVRVYEGRVQGKNRLGFYIPRIGAVRIKSASDLETAAHEIAHALDDRLPEIRESWLNGDKAKIHADELKSVSYDKTKIYEGFAEFVRLYMTQPEKAKAAAPNFYQWFDGFTQQHPYGPAIRKAQVGMGSWFKQDALHRAQSKIGMQRSLNEAMDGFADKFRQSVVDDLHGVYRMERDLTGKTAPMGPYETARLTRGAGGLVDGAIRLGAPVRKSGSEFGFQGKGMEEILKPVADNLDEFLMYSVGRSSHELLMQGREKLFTPAEVRSMLQLSRPEFVTAFEEYQTWNKGVLDFAESMGVLNKQARGMWQRTQYLPYYRAGQGGSVASKGGAQGNWSGVQALKGGTGNLRDILGNITQNAATLIDVALKNEARAKIVEMAEKQPGGGNFLVKIEPDSRQVKIEKAQVRDKLLESAGIDPKAERMGQLTEEQMKIVELVDWQMSNSPELLEFMVHGQTPQGNIMAVLRDGKPTYYEVADPLLYRAVSSLNRAPAHWIIKWLGMPKRIGQMTVTLTPDFAVANIARDTIMGAVMSKSGFKPFVDSMRGMASRIKEDPAYREYLANGGGFASYLKDENTFRAHLDRFYTSKGINPKMVLDAPDKMMYFIETLADAFEMSTRLGEYKRLREQGVQPREAAYAGREISTDFGMKGDSQVLGAMYDTVMFLRPAVVSLDRLYRGLAHDPNSGAIAAKAGTVALMSAWLYWQNKDNPTYQDLQDWDKDSYWHFFVPVDGVEQHFRWPKIWEVGALSSMAERTVAALNDQEPNYARAVGRIMGNLFHVNLMPQVAAPLVEQATNRHGFTNTPIETPGMEGLQPFLRAKPTTSETLKAAGMATRDLPEALQVNPVKAEALLRGYFNTWAMYGLTLSDEAFFGDKLPARRMDELPVIRRFYEDTPPKATKYQTMFYDMLSEARRVHGSLRDLDDMGRSDIADQMEQNPLATLSKQLERAARNVQTINADMEATMRSDMTPEEKRAKLDALTMEKNELLKSAVKDAQPHAK